MAESVLEFKKVTHTFAGGTRGLSGVSFRAAPGEFIILCGKNGSGKTTLLRHMNALSLPSEGEVLVAGVSTRKNPVQARQVVGMVFSDVRNQIVGETVADDVAFGPENLGLPEEEINKRVKASLEAVGMGHMGDRRPYLLSGGEKQRTAVAGVLAMESRVIVFDEPFSNLDYPGVKQVLQQMVNLHGLGKTIIVATHDIEKVAAHAGRILVMDNGRLALDCSLEEAAPDLEKYGVRRPCASLFGREVDSWLE
ncbi:biotin transport system ATP-binding protein [Desulfatibacillum alkenivorans DSM 16219]|uniref:Biotin transport system ATP-binding protein n=1 Tax=Desulfatibacillum alkenivorans DSM 16219 TaxID=1121393 RepID=A0A1M6T1P6_9BACT|nr:ABC transporter ATP-binding protein [Desulfatibacillum alkenivorans]SHK50841.1 biotin transport system ATP-binding protein [Desulfatibacillum alkenivorans DSM 16219]